MTRAKNTKAAKSTAAKLPDPETARRELLKREARAFVWMFVRLVCIAIFSVLILNSVPAIRHYRVILDAIGGVLILAPLFTGLGRTFAWRIALGKSYVEARRFADAEAILAVLSGIRASLFDAQGQGRYYRASALHALDRTTDALPVLREVAERGQEPWLSQAKALLAQWETGAEISKGEIG